MTFHAFFFSMPVADRDAYAKQAGTSRAMLTQVAYGNKRIELGLADVLVAVSGRAISLDMLPLTQNARRQRAIREAMGQHKDGERRGDSKPLTEAGAPLQRAVPSSAPVAAGKRCRDAQVAERGRVVPLPMPPEASFELAKRSGNDRRHADRRYGNRRDDIDRRIGDRRHVERRR